MSPSVAVTNWDSYLSLRQYCKLSDSLACRPLLLALF
jgi:hypothetical protein